MATIQDLESADLRVIRGDDGRITSIVDTWGRDVGLVSSKYNSVTGVIEITQLEKAWNLPGPSSNLGVRIPHCRIIDNIGNATGWNVHMAAEIEAQFVAVRPVFFNTQLTPLTINVAKVAVGGAWADGTGSALAWTQLTFNGSTTGVIPAATVNSRIALLRPDWGPVRSVPRSDGGSYPIAYALAYVAANAANMSFVGNGSDTYDAWVTTNAQLKFRWLNQSGVDATTTPASFTSTTVRKNGGILGFEYLLADESIIHVMTVGDSITAGFGATLVGDGWANELAYQSLATGSKVCVSNFGWNGQSTAQIARRALDLISYGFVPKYMIMSAGTPNDVTTTITQAIIDSNLAQIGMVAAACKEAGIRLILTTWLPANYSSKAYGATDALRIAFNSSLKSSPPGSAGVLDIATPLQGAINTGQVEYLAGMSVDGVHPNNAGHLLILSAVKPAIF